MDRNELPLEPRNLGIPSGASKTISKRIVHLAQTLHLSCPNTNTLSKLTEMRFHRTHHRGVPSGGSKMIFEHMVLLLQTMHLSYVKIITSSIWTETSFHLRLVTLEYHRVSTKQFLSLWYVWRKPCTYLALTLTLSPNGPKWDFGWPMTPRNSISCIKNNFQAYGMFSVNRAPILCQV
jgi:hypothetical protein